MTSEQRKLIAGVVVVVAGLALLVGGVVAYQAHVAVDAEPTLAECVGSANFDVLPGVTSDTHGQGELLGVGFRASTYPGQLVRIDRFGLTTMTTQAGETITGVKVTAHALEGNVLRGGELVKLVGPGWNGVKMRGTMHCVNPSMTGRTRTVIVRFVDAQQSRGDVDGSGQAIWVHGLEIDLAPGRSAVSGCANNLDRTFPVAGHWDGTGAYVQDLGAADPNAPTGREASFACTNRGAALCLQLGHSDSPGQLNSGSSLYEACARMVRADYCGDGTIHTREGTLVAPWAPSYSGPENSGVHDPHHFESAWTKSGVLCKDHPRWPDDRPACLAGKPDCHGWKDVHDQDGGKPVFVVGSCVEPATALPGQCMENGSAPGGPGPKTGPI